MLARFTWHSDQPDFGGISGVEVTEDGAAFTAISDTGILYQGRFERTETGKLRGVSDVLVTHLKIETGQRPKSKRARDMEGLALDRSGAMRVSLENFERILIYENDGAVPRVATLPDKTKMRPENIGFEAFAITPDGAEVVIAEGSGGLRQPFLVYQRQADQTWATFFELRRHGGFRPVGADFGVDGHLYVLLRAFNGFSFASRIERVIYKDGKPVSQEVLFTGTFGQFDNLEGITAWQDAAGKQRLVAMSDDNLSAFQSTIVVEFEVQQ